MTVLPCSFPSLHHDLALQKLFAQTHQRALETQTTQILSFSSAVEQQLDLCTVLHANLHKTKHYCYFENPQQQTAVLALGQVATADLNSPSRFEQTRQVAQSWFRKSHLGGQAQHTEAGLHCFAAFTFFAQSSQLNPVFAPATVFIPKLQAIAQPSGIRWIGNVRIHANSTLDETIAQLRRLEQQLYASAPAPPTQAKTNPQTNPQINAIATLPHPSYQPFTGAVRAALQDIQQEQLTKIVLAHVVEQHHVRAISVQRTLEQLRHSHPDCYTFALGNGSGYHFIGASPERLIRIQNRQLSTDALAGSAPRGDDWQADQAIAQRLLHSEKEHREHQVVSRYIVQQLADLGLTPNCLPRRLRRLSHIQHLWTPIQATVPPTLHPLDIVAQLHPTPAVAGIPSEAACVKIRDYEAFDRALYAAPLGWFTSQGESEFIVGIRSALVRDNWVRLYGGAGIVAGSDPERERAEVQLKLQTMSQALA